MASVHYVDKLIKHFVDKTSIDRKDNLYFTGVKGKIYLSNVSAHGEANRDDNPFFTRPGLD